MQSLDNELITILRKKDMDKEDIEEFKTLYRNAELLREIIVEVLNNKHENSDRVVSSKANYSNPNWAYFVADQLGYQRALNELKSLLTQ